MKENMHAKNNSRGAVIRGPDARKKGPVSRSTEIGTSVDADKGDAKPKSQKEQGKPVKENKKVRRDSKQIKEAVRSLRVELQAQALDEKALLAKERHHIPRHRSGKHSPVERKDDLRRKLRTRVRTLERDRKESRQYQGDSQFIGLDFIMQKDGVLFDLLMFSVQAIMTKSVSACLPAALVLIRRYVPKPLKALEYLHDVFVQAEQQGDSTWEFTEEPTERGLNSWYLAHKNSDVWKRIKWLYVCTSSVALHGVDRCKERDLKRLAEKSILQQYEDSMSLAASVVSNTKFIFTRFYQCLQTGEWHKMFHSEDTYEQWLNDTMEVEREDMDKSSTVNRQRWLKRVQDLIVQGKEMMRMCRASGIKKEMYKVIHTRYMKLYSLYARHTGEIAGSATRRTPFCVFILGRSSIGKTTLMKINETMFANLFGCDPNVEPYVRQPGRDFWDAYQIYQWCIILDDVACFNPQRMTNIDDSLKEIIQILNNVAMMANCADLEDKGRKPVIADFVQVNSNTEDLNADVYFNDTTAVCRRLQYRLLVDLRPEFQNAEGFLDSKKVAEKGGFPDWWTITVQKAKTVPGNPTANDQFVCERGTFETIPGMENVGIKEYLRWFIAASTAHRRAQDQMLENLDTIKRSEFCQHCNLPEDLCDGTCVQLQGDFSFEDVASTVPGSAIGFYPPTGHALESLGFRQVRGHVAGLCREGWFRDCSKCHVESEGMAFVFQYCDECKLILQNCGMHVWNKPRSLAYTCFAVPRGWDIVPPLVDSPTSTDEMMVIPDCPHCQTTFTFGNLNFELCHRHWCEFKTVFPDALTYVEKVKSHLNYEWIWKCSHCLFVRQGAIFTYCNDHLELHDAILSGSRRKTNRHRVLCDEVVGRQQNDRLSEWLAMISLLTGMIATFCGGFLFCRQNWIWLKDFITEFFQTLREFMWSIIASPFVAMYLQWLRLRNHMGIPANDWFLSSCLHRVNVRMYEFIHQNGDSAWTDFAYDYVVPGALFVRSCLFSYAVTSCLGYGWVRAPLYIGGLFVATHPVLTLDKLGFCETFASQLELASTTACVYSLYKLKRSAELLRMLGRRVYFSLGGKAVYLKIIAALTVGMLAVAALIRMYWPSTPKNVDSPFTERTCAHVIPQGAFGSSLKRGWEVGNLKAGGEVENIWRRYDYRCDMLDVPETSQSLKGATPNQVVAYFQRFLARVTVRYNTDSATRMFVTGGTGLLIGGSRILVMRHFMDVVQPGVRDLFSVEVHYATRKNDIKTVSFETRAFEIEDVDDELVLLHIPCLPPQRSIDVALPEKEMLDYDGPGMRIGRSKDGTLTVDEIPRIFSVEMSTGRHWFTGRGDSAYTVVGDCGSILLAMTSRGPTLVGVHMWLVHPESETEKMSISYNLCGKKFAPRIVSHMPVLNRPGSKVGKLGPLHPKSPLNFVDNKGGMDVFGSFDGFRANLQSKVVDSMISDYLIKNHGFVKTHGPPVMKGIEVKLNHLRQFSKYNASIPAADVEIAVTLLVEHLAWNLAPHWDAKIISQHDAVNGVPGIRFVDRIPLNTSTGFPYKVKKSKMIQPLIDGDWTSELVIDQSIQEDIDLVLDRLSRGERACPVFTAALKDEARKFEKIEKKNTRVFFGGPVGFIVVQRMLFTWFNRAVQNNPLLFMQAPGMNATGKQWDLLFKWLNRSDDWIAGDYKNFDISMVVQFLLGAYDVIIRLAKEMGASDEHILMMETAKYDLVFPFVDFFGDLVMGYGKNPSGQCMTVIINGLVNILYMILAYIALNPQFHQSMTRSERLELGRGFFRAVRLITYGDDNFMNVLKTGWFNHTSISQYLAKHGVTYTMADKDAQSTPYISAEQISFLKRQFRFEEEVGGYVAPLDMVSIRKALMVTLPSGVVSKEKAMVDCINTQNEEMFHHGKEKFLAFQRILNEVIDHHGLREYMNRPLLTWEELRSRWLRTIDSPENVAWKLEIKEYQGDCYYEDFDPCPLCGICSFDCPFGSDITECAFCGSCKYKYTDCFNCKLPNHCTICSIRLRVVRFEKCEWDGNWMTIYAQCGCAGLHQVEAQITKKWNGDWDEVTFSTE